MGGCITFTGCSSGALNSSETTRMAESVNTKTNNYAISRLGQLYTESSGTLPILVNGPRTKPCMP